MKRILWMLAATSVVILSAQVRAEDQPFLEGLRERRLFRLAESLCRERLALSTLPARERVHWTVDLIRCQTDLAIHATPTERPALWHNTRRTAAEFDRAYPDHPTGVLVRVQDALAALSHGEVTRMEAELDDTNDNLEIAKQVLRDAAQLLDRLDNQLTTELPNARRRLPSDDDLSADELISLQLHIWQQLTRARRNQAMCYSADSNDRRAGLNDAITFAKKALAQLPAHEPLMVEVRLEQAACLRLLGDWDAARASLFGLDTGTMSDAQQMLVNLACARNELVANEVEAARQILGKLPQSDGTLRPERDLVEFEILLAAWKQVANEKSALKEQDWLRQAREALRHIENTHGAYWGERAEAILISQTKTLGSKPGTELLRRAADRFYLQGKLDDAINQYDQAADEARALNQSLEAFELSFKAALVCQKKLEHEQARQRLRKLALIDPKMSRAGEAHLLAIWNLAQVVRQDSARAGDYRQLLEEHLQNWPTGATASTANSWLAKLENVKQLAAHDVTQMEISRGVALANAGRIGEAVEVYAVLAKSHPLDGSIQEKYGELLLLAEDRDSIVRALDQWRLVAAVRERGTPGWFRAKYSVSLSLFKLDHKQEAAKLIRFLEVTDGLATGTLKEKFAELLRNCE